MWTGRSLLGWLASLGISSEHPDADLRLDRTPGDGHGILLGRIGQNIPDKPDRIVVATPIRGAGRTDQGAFKRPGFQLRVRGPARDLDSTRAEHMAAHYHEWIVTAGGESFTAPDGTHVLSVALIGGEPAQVGPRDTAERAEFFSTYLVHAKA